MICYLCEIVVHGINSRPILIIIYLFCLSSQVLDQYESVFCRPVAVPCCDVCCGQNGFEKWSELITRSTGNSAIGKTSKAVLLHHGNIEHALSADQNEVCILSEILCTVASVFRFHTYCCSLDQ